MSRKLGAPHQNRLREGFDGKPNDIQKIIETYQFRKEEDRYSKRVSMERIAEEGFNLNISRYISSAVGEAEIDLVATQKELVDIENQIREATRRHNDFLKDLGLSQLPGRND